MTRILIVDNQASFRRSLRQLLTLAGLEVAGEAGDIPAAQALLPTLRPDLAVVDIMLPGINGMEGAPLLRAALPGLRVILVSAYRDQAEVFEDAAREVGAEAFLPKDDIDIALVQGWKVCK